jgi:hypothetical protein
MLTNIEKTRLRNHPIDHLIGRTIRLVDRLRASPFPDIAADAKEVWEAWRTVRSAVVKSTQANDQS